MRLDYRGSSANGMSSQNEAFRVRPTAFVLATLAVPAMVSAQGSMIMVSVDSEGNKLSAHNTLPVDVSADGRLTTFWGAGISSPYSTVFTHDRVSGLTRVVSVDSAGLQGDNHSWSSSISADGRIVAFYGDASNLVLGDTNDTTDVFVHDLVSGVTTRVSVSSSGMQGSDWSYLPDLSTDGRFVAFESFAPNLVPGDANGQADVFVHDRRTNQTMAASVDSAGLPSDGFSYEAAISGRGRFVAFASTGTNLVPGDTNGFYDVFVRDVVSGLTVRASVSSAGAQGNARSRNPDLSADGRFVVFQSDATNLVPGDTNDVGDVFVHDLWTGETRRVSVDSSGGQGLTESFEASISADGRFVAFTSAAFTSAPTPRLQAMVHDRVTGETRNVSTTPDLLDANRNSWAPALSDDGRFVVFASDASDIVPNDPGINFDVFSYDREGASPTIASYCTSATTSHGCQPAISGVGVPRNAASGFTVTVSGVEGGKAGLFFYGVTGSQQVPFGAGTGTLCVRMPLQRTSTLQSSGTAGACDGQLTFDWNTYMWTHPGALGTPPVRGATVWIQAWMRDPLAAGGSSVSDALWFTVCP